jgi:hypothetical protein
MSAVMMCVVSDGVRVCGRRTGVCLEIFLISLNFQESFHKIFFDLKILLAVSFTKNY